MRIARLEEREFRLDDEQEPLRTIRGRIAYPAAAEEAGARLPTVLVLHGFKGFMDWGFFPELTRRLVARGFAVLRFNFSGSGHGERPLEFTEPRAFFENTPTKELDDLERVRAWLASGAAPVVDPTRLALLGHSLGGAVALLHAAKHGDLRALVGWATVSTFRRFPPEVEVLWRRQGFVEIPNVRTKEVHRLGLGWLEDIDRNARGLDLHGACRRLTTPTLWLHGSDDEAVPVSEGESLAQACAPGVARLELIPGANHTFWASHPLQGVSGALEHTLSATADFLAARLP